MPGSQAAPSRVQLVLSPAGPCRLPLSASMLLLPLRSLPPAAHMPPSATWLATRTSISDPLLIDPAAPPHVCSLFEIDLHGLHAAEAVAALERRLRLLADMAADLAGCTGGLGPVPAVLDGARPPGSRQASAAAGGPPGPGGVLRVVVGRGSHSRGGDASLPRVVERHLRERGFGLAARAGALDVLLGRRFGVRL